MAQCNADVYGPNPANGGKVEPHKCGNTADPKSAHGYCHLGVPGTPVYVSSHVAHPEWGAATAGGASALPEVAIGVGLIDGLVGDVGPSVVAQAEAIVANAGAITWPRSASFPKGETPELTLALEGHKYVLPTGDIAAGVTTTLGDTVGSIGKTRGMVASAVRLTKEGKDYQEVWDAKRDRGSRVHEVLEAIAKGQAFTVENDEDKPLVEQLTAWVEKNKPEFLLSEVILLSHHGYGGRCDVLIRLENPDTGELETWLLDLKTGWSDISHHFQAAAYAGADGVAVYDDEGYLLGTTPLPKIDKIGALYLNADWPEAKLVEFKRRDGDFETFLALNAANQHIKEMKRQQEVEERELRYTNAARTVAANLHDDWRVGRQLPSGTYEPLVQNTTDQAWALRFGSYQVDVANTEFRYLPTECKAGHQATADHAVSLVRSLGRKWANPAFLEAAAERIHQGRLLRLGGSAAPALQVPFGDLSANEQERCRRVVKMAIGALGKQWTNNVPKAPGASKAKGSPQGSSEVADAPLESTAA